MKEFEFNLSEGSLSCIRDENDSFIVTGYHGLAGQVVIPELLPLEQENLDVSAPAEEGSPKIPVGKIGKKAFLSKKYLRRITVPATVTEVGDWAFAYCDSLREVTFLGKNVDFGKAVFMECPKLECVRFSEEGEKSLTKQSGVCDGVGALLAAAVTQMDSPYLLDGREAGSREWLGKWDARMMAILNAADDEGYAKQILCGEEDYESADLDTYLMNSRKKKVRLLLLRLLWPMELEPRLAERLKAYLLAHTKGCKTEETWLVIRDEYGDKREFYELFTSLGCLTKENAPAIISETREENPEMKAFFLKFQAQYYANSDFFDNLEL